MSWLTAALNFEVARLKHWRFGSSSESLDVFERLPTLKNRDLAQLLPHNWHGTATQTPSTATLAAA